MNFCVQAEHAFFKYLAQTLSIEQESNFLRHVKSCQNCSTVIKPFINDPAQIKTAAKKYPDIQLRADLDRFLKKIELFESSVEDIQSELFNVSPFKDSPGKDPAAAVLANPAEASPIAPLFSLKDLNQEMGADIKDEKVQNIESSGLIDILKMSKISQEKLKDKKTADTDSEVGASTEPPMLPFSDDSGLSASKPKGNRNIYIFIAIIAVVLVGGISILGIQLFNTVKTLEAKKEIQVVEKIIEKKVIIEKKTEITKEERLAKDKEAKGKETDGDEDSQKEKDEKKGPTKTQKDVTPALPGKTTPNQPATLKKIDKDPKAALPRPTDEIAPPTETKVETKVEKRDKIDNILDGIAPKKKVEPEVNLPKQLTREQILAMMQSIKGQIFACRNQGKERGIIDIGFKILGSGKTTGVYLNSAAFKGSGVGSCVLGVIFSLVFPQFSGTPMSVASFPFEIK